MAGIFQVMAFGVRALDKKDIDPAFMAKLSKIATAEMISSKELNADWQRAASTLLVSIGSHLSDLRKQNTVTRDKKETEFIAHGRHDICVVPRAVPMVGAMVALVLVDQLMAQYA